MIYIYTLGDFDIRINDNSILESKNYPYRTMKLFKYFLTFKGKKILPENIIEDLWVDNNFQDPKNVLRTQISRTRKMIDLGKMDLESCYDIQYINGYYVFETRNNCILDAELFEKYIVQGNTIKEEKPDEALLLLNKGLELYKGTYLGEMDYEEWLVPIRNRYHRLYLKGLFNYIEILKQKGKNLDIVKTCEEAIHLELYDENLHIYFIEALMEIGETRYAISHYEYITSRLYNHLGVKPSSRMRMLYRKLQSQDKVLRNTINLYKIDEELEQFDEANGPLICEPYYFKFLYNLEKRKGLRNVELNKFLGVMTIENQEHLTIGEEDLKNSMNTLMEIINVNLRRGDVLSKWNDNQIVSLLYNIEQKNLNIVVNRLQNKFKQEIRNKDLILDMSFKAL